MMSIFCSVKSEIWIFFEGIDKNNNLPYSYYMVSKRRIDMSRTVKIIHVHFMSGHRNYYFGSVRAIYKKFTPEEVGCSEIYLRHQLTQRGNHFLNEKILVIRSTLLR